MHKDKDERRTDHPGTEPVTGLAAIGVTAGLVAIAAEGTLAKLLGVPLAVAVAWALVLVSRRQGRRLDPLGRDRKLAAVAGLALLLGVGVIASSISADEPTTVVIAPPPGGQAAKPFEPEVPSRKIAVQVSSSWDPAHLYKTSRRGWCLPRHVINVSADNSGRRTLTLQRLYLVIPPRASVHGDVETVLQLKSSKVVGWGAYTGTALPHTLLPGRHAEFDYAAIGSAAVRPTQFVRVETNLTEPVEKEVPPPTRYAPVRCNR